MNEITTFFNRNLFTLLLHYIFIILNLLIDNLNIIKNIFHEFIIKIVVL